MCGRAIERESEPGKRRGVRAREWAWVCRRGRVIDASRPSHRPRSCPPDPVRIWDSLPSPALFALRCLVLLVEAIRVPQAVRHEPRLVIPLVARAADEDRV